MASRFAARFPGRVAVLHSGLGAGEAFDEWWRIRDGEFDVVIGSRSAIFSPQPDLGLIVIDYLQLMTSHSRRVESRQVEVSEISRGLKILARELDCPVVALAQLNRQLEYRQDKRPMLADLRESGSIEQDADVVMFIYRDESYNAESDQRGTAEILVAKHRNGPTGSVRLAFLDHYTKFANMARE